MTNASSAGMRELGASEIEMISGGNSLYYFPSANIGTVFGRDAATAIVGGLNAQYGPDRAQTYAEARRLQAAYAANPDTPRSEVYADFYML